MDLVHQHLLIRAFLKNPPLEEEQLKNWFRKVVSAIDMKVCIEPQAKYVDATGNKGLTGLVGIETSHMSAHCTSHFWDECSPALVQLDVYSCKQFNPDTIIEMLSEFGLVSYEAMLIDREDGFKIISHTKIEAKS